MSFFNERNLTIALISGIVLGVILGFSAQGSADDSPIRGFVETLSIFGRLFLASLKMVVVPLVLFSVTSGIANLGGSGEVGRKLTKTIFYFAATSFLAVLVGMVYTNLVGPGKGLNSDELFAALPENMMVESQEKQSSVAAGAPANLTEFINVQIGNIFMNPFASLAQMNLVGVVFFGLFLGLMILLTGEKGRPAREFFDSMNQALMGMVQVVIWIAPVGVMALAANLLMSIGPEVLAPLMKYFLTVVFALLTQLLIIYPLILWFLGGINPLRFFAGMKEAMLLALTTASSSATLPVTLRCVEENLGVDKRSANFVLPMGATINMDGTALYEAVAAIFVAQLIGMQMGIEQQFIVFFTATLAAIGAAGIPQAGLVTMVIVFNALDLPLELMALIIVVDRPLDHIRTMVNVTGDATGSLVLSKSEETSLPTASEPQTAAAES